MKHASYMTFGIFSALTQANTSINTNRALTLWPGIAVRLRNGSTVLLPVLGSTQIIWQRLQRPWLWTTTK